MRIHADGPLKVKPDPAKPGQDVEVTYLGSGRVRYRTDGGWTELPIDPKTKKGKFKVPVGAAFITVADDRGHSVYIEVIRSRP